MTFWFPQKKNPISLFAKSGFSLALAEFWNFRSYARKLKSNRRTVRLFRCPYIVNKAGLAASFRDGVVVSRSSRNIADFGENVPTRLALLA
jgi:hypothetical protein